MKLIILVGPLFFASCEQIWTVEDQRHLIKKKKGWWRFRNHECLEASAKHLNSEVGQGLIWFDIWVSMGFCPIIPELVWRSNQTNQGPSFCDKTSPMHGEMGYNK